MQSLSHPGIKIVCSTPSGSRMSGIPWLQLFDPFGVWHVIKSTKLRPSLTEASGLCRPIAIGYCG